MPPAAIAPCSPRPISEVAARLGLGPDDIEPWGWSKAKCALGLERRLADRPLGKYIGVTAVTPTPLGEGKTVVAIGLAMALCRLGKSAVAALREPSLAPVFGLKGGGAGGGRALLVPADDINLHFTGDLHAVTAANNLLAALVDNHVRRRLAPVMPPESITWRRAIDVSDKGLAHIITGLDSPPQAPQRETGFDLTAASEVMAILALASDLPDLRARLGRIIVGMTPEGGPVTADDLHAAGAMAALLRDAIRPNIVQTCEGTPAFVHAGPFANIAHGNSSVIADRIALRLADYVVTESGFGADCGGEKFFNIKCRSGGFVPSAEVLVCTVRSLKLHAGQVRMPPGKPLPPELLVEDLHAVRVGAVNLQANLELLRRFGIPVVVAVNRFPQDTQRELDLVRELALGYGAHDAAVIDAFAEGSAGAVELAEAVIAACSTPGRLEFTYPLDLPLQQKFEHVATQVYGADGVDFAPLVERRLQQFARLGFSGLPVCIAKTQYSLSHDPARLGRPAGFRMPINDVRLSAGAGFVYGLAGDIVTMPGLPSHPAAARIDVDADGRVLGIL